MGFLSKIGKTIGKVAGIAGDIGGIASTASGLFGSGVEDQQNFASAQAAQSRAFTKEQLQNRHQWEVEDLRKAGLNPILSAMKGAPSIGGSAQAVSNANTTQDLAQTVSSAAQAKQQRLNEQKVKAEINLLQSQANNQNSQARNTANLGNISQNIGNLSSGFHGLTTSAASKIRENIADVKNIPKYIKQARENRKKSDYISPTKRIFNRYFKKGN
jgi:cell division protein FtsB